MVPLIDNKSDIETQMIEMQMISTSSENYGSPNPYGEEDFYSSCKEFVSSFEIESPSEDFISSSKIESSSKEFSSKALVYGCILSALNQLTGISAVTFYSNELFTQGKQGNEVEWKARIGTMYIGIMSVVGC